MHIIKQDYNFVNNNLPSAEWPAAVGGLTDRRSNRQTNNNRTERTQGTVAASVDPCSRRKIPLIFCLRKSGSPGRCWLFSGGRACQRGRMLCCDFQKLVRTRVSGGVL